MANTDIVQVIAEARADAKSLSEFVFKPAGFKVTRRLAPPIDTLQFYIDRFDATRAATNAYVATIPSIVNDAINNTATPNGVLADTFVTVTKKTTNAVARTLGSVNKERVSVKDYGAIGDGVADDTIAFKNAILDAPPNTTIYMPHGIYRLTSALTWKTQLSLIGDGVGSSVIKMDGELFSAIQSVVDIPPYGLNPDGSSYTDSLENCRFEDFEIDGSGLTYPDAHVDGKGIFILAMKRSLFRNLYIHHTIGTGLGCDFLDDTVIENCNVSYCGRNFGKAGHIVGQSGIGIGTGQKHVENVTVSNCTTNHNGNYGVFVEIQNESLRDWSPTGAKIANCYAEGNRYGFGNRMSGSTIFSGCHAYKNKEFGFYSLKTKYGSNIYNACFAESNTLSGFRSERPSGLDKFIGCVSFNNESHGFHISTENLRDEYMGKEGVSISSCTSYKNTGSGYVIGSSPVVSAEYMQGRHSISDSIAIECGANGFLSSDLQNLSVSACDFSKNSLVGLKIIAVAQYSDYSIQNNRLTKNGNQGLLATIDKDCLSFDFIGNKVINNCEASLSGSRQGAKIFATKKALVHAKNNSFISTNIDKQASGFVVEIIGVDAAFKVIDNIFDGHGSTNLTYTGNMHKSEYIGNIGFNDISTISEGVLGASPAIIDKKPYPVRYYLRSTSDDISVKKGVGTSFIVNSKNVTLDVPANAEGYTVTYGSSITVHVQKY